LKEMEAFFPTVGVYTVVVAVDSTNFVPELATDGETNNVAQLEVVLYPLEDDPDDPWGPGDPVDPEEPPDVEIPDVPVGPMIYLPLIAK